MGKLPSWPKVFIQIVEEVDVFQFTSRKSCVVALKPHTAHIYNYSIFLISCVLYKIYIYGLSERWEMALISQSAFTFVGPTDSAPQTAPSRYCTSSFWFSIFFNCLFSLHCYINATLGNIRKSEVLMHKDGPFFTFSIENSTEKLYMDQTDCS